MEGDPVARIDRLEDRVARLEEELERLAADAGPPAARSGQPTEWAPPAVVASVEPGAPWPTPEIAAPQPVTRPLLLESETILKWGGIGLVVLAVGFAVSTAISRGWIGPELQLAGALLVALGLIGLGLRLRSSRPAWTHALCSGGVLALYTTFASNLFLDQAVDEVAFVATAVSGLIALSLTWTIRSDWTGAAGLLGGAVGWSVIADGDLPFAGSAGWFGGLITLGLIVALHRRMLPLRFTAHALGVVLVLSIAEAAEPAASQVVAVAIAAALFAALARLPSIGDLSSIWQQLEIQLTIAAAPMAFAVVGITYELDGEQPIGWTAIAVAAGAAAVAVGVRRWIRTPHLLSLLIGAGVTLSIGFAVLLSTTVVFVALAVQGVGLVLLARSFDREIRVLVNAALLLAIATSFVTNHMLEAWTDDASIGDDIAHLVIVAALPIAAWLAGYRTLQQLIALATLALVLIWTGSVLVHLPQGQAAVSICWAVIGIGVLIAGAIRGMPEVGATGLAVIGITVAKLLTVDLQEVDTLWRAGLFLVVGLGIMRIGFLLPRFTREDDTTERRTGD